MNKDLYSNGLGKKFYWEVFVPHMILTQNTEEMIIPIQGLEGGNNMEYFISL